MRSPLLAGVGIACALWLGAIGAGRAARASPGADDGTAETAPPTAPSTPARAPAATPTSSAPGRAPPSPAAASAPADENDAAGARRWWGLGVAAGVPAAILSVGFVNWYISHRVNFDLSRFHTRPRGWFGRDTHVGGHDNLGHMYANYVCQIEVAHMFEWIGYERGAAALYGTLVTAFTFNMIELLDSFTDYGWEYSDTVFNAGGQLLGLLTHLYGLGHYAQLRMSWLPSRLYLDGGIPRYEVVEDYGGQRFYLVANTAGILDRAGLDAGLARYLMPGVFYDTRGYRPALPAARYDQRERNLGLAVLIDLAAIVRERWPGSPWARRGATFLRYFQPPFLGFAYGYDLNSGRWHVPDYTLTLTGRF